MKIKYMVVPVTRFMAVRFVKNDDDTTDTSEVCGEFENSTLAYSAAFAMAYTERDNPPENVKEVVMDDMGMGWLKSDLARRPPRFGA